MKIDPVYGYIQQALITQGSTMNKEINVSVM